MQPKLTRQYIVFFIASLFILWMAVFKDFLTGAIVVNIDTSSTYGAFKYFYNNLLNGVIPLWEPYLYLGRPHIQLALVGVLNILVVPIYLLHYIGFNFYQLYLIYLTAYLLLGITGFYLLSKHIIKNDSYALIAACLLLFSGLPAMLFNQIFIPMLFVPALWFFVFFLKFFTDFKTCQFWGMICSLMVLAVSYYPFYFLCLFLSFLIFYVIAFWQNVPQKTISLINFIRVHWLTTSIGITFIVIAFIPLFLFKALNDTGEITSPSRHNCEVTDQCPAKSEMTFDEVAYDGTLGERYLGGTLFSNLDKFNYNDDCLIYAPSLIFIILLLAMFTVMDRIRFLIFSTASAVFIISLGAVTPLYKILFDHVFFFKYFRNLFFFAAFVIPLVILFAVAQFKALYEQLMNTKNKLWPIALITVGHVLFLSILSFQDNVILPTYLTVVLSFLFFTALTLGLFNRRAWLLIPFITITILIEPVSVFSLYSHSILRSANHLPQNHEIPKFEYTRPPKNASFHYKPSTYGMFAQLADFKDSSGDVDFVPEFLNSRVFSFYSKVPADKKEDYMQHKLAIYEHAPQYDSFENASQVLLSDSKELTVSRFDVNSLTVNTNFESPKFLVYRDAYSTYWKAFINGAETKIQIVDGAFKGLELPPGKNVIEFRYIPPGGQGIYILVLVTMLIAFCMLGVSYLRPRRSGD